MALKSIGLGAVLAFGLWLGSIGTAGAVGLGGICGPIRDGACDTGLFCERKAGTCNLIGGTGRCVRVPEACAMIWEPVCGCNGRTYSNDCERVKAQTQKAHDGPCQ